MSELIFFRHILVFAHFNMIFTFFSTSNLQRKAKTPIYSLLKSNSLIGSHGRLTVQLFIVFIQKANELVLLH